MMNIKQLGKITAGLTMVFAASQSFAGPLNISSIGGNFENAVTNPGGGGTIAFIDAPAAGTDNVAWGTPPQGSSTGQSSYDFTPNGALVGTSPNLDTPFLLGTLVHNNNPILAPILVSVDYALALGTNGVPSTVNYSLFIEHNETPNQPCPAPGCNDIVTASDPANADVISQNGDNYILTLLGWAATQGGPIGGLDLETVEGQSTPGFLYAQLTEAPEVVPEPGLLTLLGLGLLGLGATRLRKSS